MSTRRCAPLLATALLGIGFTCITRDASALGPVDVEVAGKVGYGTNPFSGYPNPLGLGLGVRGGVSLLGFYGGLSFMYYIGSSQNVASQGGSISAHSVAYGIEGGYGTKLFGLLTLRGQLGLGNFTASGSGALSGNSSNLYLEPGLTALLSFGPVLVGADANVLVLPGINDPLPPGQSSWDAAFTVHAQGGVKF
jgi:hypothetical protein